MSLAWISYLFLHGFLKCSAATTSPPTSFLCCSFFLCCQLHSTQKKLWWIGARPLICFIFIGFCPTVALRVLLVALLTAHIIVCIANLTLLFWAPQCCLLCFISCTSVQVVHCQNYRIKCVCITKEWINCCCVWDKSLKNIWNGTLKWGIHGQQIYRFNLLSVECRLLLLCAVIGYVLSLLWIYLLGWRYENRDDHTWYINIRTCRICQNCIELLSY